MRAMVLEECKSVEEKPLKLLDVPKPVPARNEIRIKIKACGVCHTDLHTVEGELSLPKMPIVPGHEIVGIVDELGEECRRYKKGERVGVAWLYSSCGLCKFCKMGLENLCENAKFTGLHANGGYEEYMVVREDYAYPIPDIFSDENAAPLLCAGIIGYRSFRLSNIKPGQKLGLFGFGASAHIVIQIANILGCDVYVFTRSEKHREHARKLGAKWVGDARDICPEKLDSAIIFAPAGWIVREALKSLDRAGVLVINAIHMSPIPELPYDLLWHERKIVSVANVTREDAEQFLKIAGRIPIRTEVRLFKLEDANVALELMKKSEIEGAAVLRIE
ncbi:MAG: zinc-dependent alcohol dehydrogenase family protein [Methanomassiliicoccales archaeon]|nr:zinc-dependent alcohol dehydrogenase family protein [Methanomassiliicoccales archaeon]